VEFYAALRNLVRGVTVARLLLKVVDAYTLKELKIRSQHGRSAMPCKEPVRTLENTLILYGACNASFWHGKPEKLGDLSILRTNRKDVLEPYLQEETDWICTVEGVNRTV